MKQLSQFLTASQLLRVRPLNAAVALSVAALLPAACAAPLTLNLSLLNGDQPFFFHQPLTLRDGQALDVTEVKLFVSNVALVKADGSEVPVPGLTLTSLKVGAGSQDRPIFTGDAPTGEYRGVRFDVGVPRALNHLDATQATGPLSIENGMYWAWNSGYIFMSVLGKTRPAGTDTPKAVALHVGGDNHRVTVNLADLQKPGTALKVGDQGAQVGVTLNLAQLLGHGLNGAAWDLSQGQYQQVHMGAVADQLADNARTAFGLKK